MMTHASGSGNATAISVTCAGSAGSTCTVTVTLTVVETTRAHRVLAVSAVKQGNKGKTIQRTVIVGRKTFTLGAGASKTVHVALNRTGERLLQARHTLRVRLTSVQNGLPLYSQTLTLKMPPAKRPKR